MADAKTIPTGESVDDYIAAIDDEGVRADCGTLIEIMGRATGAEPRMWGPSIVGFGTYHYKYASGREGDWPLTGFAPRKRNLTLYIMAGFDRYGDLMRKLGKHKTGKSCLYVNRLSDIDLDVLDELVRASVDHVKEQYG